MECQGESRFSSAFCFSSYELKWCLHSFVSYNVSSDNEKTAEWFRESWLLWGCCFTQGAEKTNEGRAGFSCHVATILSSGFSPFMLHHSERTTALKSLISCAVWAHRLPCLLFGDCYSAMSCCLTGMLWRAETGGEGLGTALEHRLPFTIFWLESFLMTLSLLMS